MSQIATTIEQSKRLLAAGLDPGSADMFWRNRDSVNPEVIPKDSPVIYKVVHSSADLFTPAWSLSKLWDICNDSGIGPMNFGGGDLDSSVLIAKLVNWIVLGIHDYEVLDEYLNAKTRQEQSHANH